MAYAKVQLERDWKSHSAGDVVECSHADAEALLADGSAVPVENSGSYYCDTCERNHNATSKIGKAHA